MRITFLLALMMAMSAMAAAQAKITLAVGDRTITAALADNDAARKLASLLADGPMDVRMDDYGGFEKVGALPQSLPASDTRITTVPGDIMLYQGRNMVVFYGSNTWAYTPLGKISGATPEALREFLGSGSVVMTLSLNTPAAADAPEIARNGHPETIYDLSGNPVDRRSLSPGVYIVDGRKTFIR